MRERVYYWVEFYNGNNGDAERYDTEQEALDKADSKVFFGETAWLKDVYNNGMAWVYSAPADEENPQYPTEDMDKYVEVWDGSERIRQELEKRASK